MSWMPIEWERDASPPDASTASLRLRLASAVLRIAFIALLLVVTLRVSLPQSETIWTIYDTPGDVIRMALGLMVCVWLAVQLFAAAPKDAHSHRTWTYLGLVVVPFGLICALWVW